MLSRAEGLVTVLGLVVIAAILLLGLVRVAQRRGRTRTGQDEPDGLFDDGGDEVASNRGPPWFGDFRAALEQYVVPLHEAHPDWDRLDGAVGLPGRGAFRFERDGIRFETNGETRFAPLLAARAWLAANPGKDPLEVERAGRVGRLRLRAEIWPEANDVRIETN